MLEQECVDESLTDTSVEAVHFEFADDDGVVFALNKSYECSSASEDEDFAPNKITVCQPKETEPDYVQRQGRLLLVSLLENFCSLYDKNPRKNHKLFLILCRKLSSMGILESADFVEDAANVRTVYKRAFKDLVFEAIKGLEDGESNRFLLEGKHEDEEKKSEEDLSTPFDELSVFDELLSQERSRYNEDFLELFCLGKGGFGTVFKAQNRLDGHYYAVKKIKFSSTNSPRYHRILREVKSLAGMDHSNIVRYNAAWVEDCRNHDLEYFEEKSGDESMISSSAHISDSTNDEGINLEIKGPGLVMYIQMELCHYTLADWIARRNGLLFSGAKWDLDEFPVDYYRMVCCNSSGSVDINIQENKRIFKAIVKGLQYIHYNGLIHRDLKPQNIFFHGTDHIPKIGDFGLVSSGQYPIDSGLSRSISDPSGDKTSGIGTSVYASPEQMAGSVYDEKSDIYSLGIILFELFFPIKTHMERARLLSDLKTAKQFPTEFLRQWPKEAALIWCCLSVDPSNRPSADEILDSELMDLELEEHFLRISEDNEDLRELLRIQFEENARLKVENELQSLEIEALKEKIALLQATCEDD